VGLAFQNLAGADNIGYVIPTPIIRRFLEDIKTEQQDDGFLVGGVLRTST